MLSFNTPEIDNYCIDHSSHPSTLCDELEKYTKENVYSPQMLIGKLEASLLGFLIRSLKVSKILEIGTYTGYSALAMAENLNDDGKIITIDINEETHKIAKSFWARSPHGHKITAIIEPALDALTKIDEKFDLVFIDADKRNYLNYLKLTLNMLSDQGIIIIDNCLWSGNVIHKSPEVKAEKTTEAIIKVNHYIKNNDSLFACMLPIRDGMYLVKKK